MSDLLLVVGLNGSPHPDGNTASLLQQALEVVAAHGLHTEIIHCHQSLKSKNVPFCQGCEPRCTAKCYRGREMEEHLRLLARADAIIMASPVYFGTLSGQIKAFWDHSRLLRQNQLLLNTVGGGIAVGGSRFGGQEPALKIMHDIMLAHGMLVVGDGFSGYDCGHLGANCQAPAALDEHAINRARLLGMRVSQVAEATSRLRKGVRK
ncbi:MAG: flavodoxin family protein [Methylocystaceae bacterium]